MRISEGNLTQQYYCDYLTVLAEDIFSGSVSDELRSTIHENIVFRNLFLHRMSVDGGFHAKVLSTLLSKDEGGLLRELLAAVATTDFTDAVPVDEWLKCEYGKAIDESDLPRKIAVSALLRSSISGTNVAAEIIAAFGDQHPESWWQLRTRRLTVTEVRNSEMYLGVGRRPFWHEFPLDRFVAVSAGCPGLLPQEVYDAVVCIAGVWFSSLSREEMLVWLNAPQVTVAEWGILAAPLLKMDNPDAAMSTANWLYASGNYDAAVDLYANITLAYPETPAESQAFELIGSILRKNGDFDNAFEAYKNAFLSAKTAGDLQIAFGLKNLCEVGEDLGEDMGEYYTRIAGIAETLSSEDRGKLWLELASSCRRRKEYLQEYSYLEKILSDELPGEKVFSIALSRLTEMNLRLGPDGAPDKFALAEVDAADEREVSKTRGDAAYFGFDPQSALYWYSRSGDSPEITSLLFRAAVAGGDVTGAAKYATSPVERSIQHILEGAPLGSVISALNDGVCLALKSKTDITDLLEPVFLMLGPEGSQRVSEALIGGRGLSEDVSQSRRSKRGDSRNGFRSHDDERANVCLGISRVYLDMGMVDEARSMLRSAIRSNPSRETRARLFLELGWLEHQAGFYKAAIDAYLSCIKISDTYPSVHAGIAQAKLSLGLYSEALSAAEKATLQNPANESYQHMRAALSIVSAEPSDPVADLLFVLPEPGYLQAAAAIYAENSQSGYIPEAWDVLSIDEVLLFRR